MTKANAVKRPRTSADIRLAEERIRARLDMSGMNHDDDHPADVLRDVGEELVTARSLLEEIRGFVSTWHARFSRR